MREAALSRGDLTDGQWRILDPLLPDRGERGPPIEDKRRTVNGILWVLRTGAPQALECRDEPRIVFANRATPAPSAANAPLRQRFCVDIILAAIDRRTGEPGDLRYNRETAPTSSPHLPRRKPSPPPLVELRADRFPSLPNCVLVDHTTDLRLFTQHRNPRHPSYSDAQRRIAI